jgi:glycosyltransferase involved in cell wall biosynthesis
LTALTIGIPTYNDFDGVYFTVQALRQFQDLADTELVVVDNYGCEHTRKFVEAWGQGRYILATEEVGTAAAKNRLFAAAQGEAVLCCDAHVLFAPGVIARLTAYYRAHPDTPDLLQGPLVADDLTTVCTHMEPIWRNELWGVWASDPRGLDPDAEPFEIPMQGMGVFSCRREAWPGFHPALRGFGGEEGYLHEKVRQRGGRCLCLPWLRWVHRFARPAGVPYPALLKDKVRNYLIGFRELGLDLAPVRDHFSARLSSEAFDALVREAEEMAGAAAEQASSSPEAGRTSPSRRVSVTPGSSSLADSKSRRAIVCFVEDRPELLHQLRALRLSWLESACADTDLVVMGPPEVLARLPHDLIKIPQQPAADNPIWSGYRFINPIAALNGPGAEQLDRYTHLLRTDVDTFITPAWNAFRPETFTVGFSTYANGDVPRRIRDLAARYGLTHRGLSNVHTTWYGPTELVRRTAAFTEMLTKELLTRVFALDPGQWPGWYRGVAVRYAGEIAVNHCAPDTRQSPLLDVSSASSEPTSRYPHIHCWHTDEDFSKHRFLAGGYDDVDPASLDPGVIRDYCLALSLRAAQ